MPAALAADLEIHADAQNIEPVRAAGVWFFCLNHITDLYVHHTHRLSVGLQRIHYSATGIVLQIPCIKVYYRNHPPAAVPGRVAEYNKK